MVALKERGLQQALMLSVFPLSFPSQFSLSNGLAPERGRSYNIYTWFITTVKKPSTCKSRAHKFNWYCMRQMTDLSFQLILHEANDRPVFLSPSQMTVMSFWLTKLSHTSTISTLARFPYNIQSTAISAPPQLAKQTTQKSLLLKQLLQTCTM